MPLKVCSWPILLQKSFWGDERNFLGLLMRFVCGDVRVLIVSYENDHGPSHRRYRALQRSSCLKICFREIFGVVRFSTFATISARNRHGRRYRRCPVLGVQRKSDFEGGRSVVDPGCVKTCASRECRELFSPSFDCDCQCRSFPIQRNRDKISTRKFDVGVFTQPWTRSGHRRRSRAII
jgi:hypothetical protein